ncbi:MAG: hypothetical protein JOZ24_11850 [Candidatus Eremiobacteraeota bacterium]|nr:hypothetical protein [Candidatus Eremiobacteraeota bacterium]
MIDFVAEGLRAAVTRSPFAIPLLFGAGIVSSVGPCIAPRYVAVAALAQARHSRSRIGAFVAGTAAAYVAIGLTAGALEALVSSSRLIYTGLAGTLCAAGIATLWREPSHADRMVQSPASVGAAFLLGASSAFVVSPCCTPVVAALAGITIGAGSSVHGGALLFAFACGHVVPLVTSAAFGRPMAHLAVRLQLSQAPTIIAATLMLALAGYYGSLL